MLVISQLISREKSPCKLRSSRPVIQSEAKDLTFGAASHKLISVIAIAVARFLASLGMTRHLCCGKHSAASYARRMRFLMTFVIAGVAVAGMAGCAEVKKPAAQAKAMPTGLRFDQVGRVALYAGEPCASQIMFEFHGSESTVWLAAPRSESDTLAEAANKKQRVHVSGKWRRGGQRNCSYVEVASAELRR